MDDVLLSLVTIKKMLVSYSYVIAAFGGAVLYYSYSKALNVLFVLGTLILGVGLGALLFRLISSIIV